jgi:hypothetical protein
MRQRDQREMRPPRTQRVEASPQQARKRKDKDAKEARTTMTDFRIVGIEVKGLDWSWGLVGEHVVDAKEEKAEDVKPEAEPEAKEEAKDVKPEKPDEKPETEPEAAAKAEPDAEEAKPDAEAKPEAAEKEEAPDAADEKRGEKRKARKSSVDGGELGWLRLKLTSDEAQSPKKRSFILTHNKVNTPGDGPSPESNQNRFRIYFESPPELDRVPKAARRNPNKRWRRESTTLDETVHEETHEELHEEGAGTSEAPAPAEQAKEETATQAAPAEANDDKPAEEAPAEVKTEAPSESAEPAAPAEPAAEASSEAAVAAEKEAPAEGAEDKEEIGDVSMVTDPGGVEGAETEQHEHSGLTGAEASAAEVEAALAESAQNAASAYGSRQKPRGRRWSTSSIGSDAETDTTYMTALTSDVTQPSVNRVSVLYEDSSRRLVFDASVVQKVRIFRSEGRIEFDVHPPPAPTKEVEAKEGDAEAENKEASAETELPKGVLVRVPENNADPRSRRTTPPSSVSSPCRVRSSTRSGRTRRTSRSRHSTASSAVSSPLPSPSPSRSS